MTIGATSRIATVIVNYRTADLVIENIPALIEECKAFPGSLIYIVDNASPGDDAKKLAAIVENDDLRQLVRVILSAENGGFGAGNNIALREILAKPAPPNYILLLNPDARLLPGALSAMVARFTQAARAGAVGPRLENAAGQAQTSAFRFHTIASDFEMMASNGLISKILAGQRVFPDPVDNAGRWDWVSGAAVLFSRECLADIGLFDETYFLYYEETDLMLRAHRKGWEVWYEPAARVVHLGGASTTHCDSSPLEMTKMEIWRRSRAHYFRKNHGKAYATAADFAWISGMIVRLLRSMLNGADTRALRSDLAAFCRGQAGRSDRKTSPSVT